MPMYPLHSAHSHCRVRSTSAPAISTLPVSCRISLRRAMQAACKHLAVIEQVLEPRAQQQMSPILVRLHQHGQEKIAALFRHLFGTQNLQTLREIDHFGDRGRFFERVVAEGKSDPRYTAMEAAAR